MADSKTKKIKDAISVLIDLDMPAAQQNDRTALCLLALLDLTPTKNWSNSSSPLMGITPIMKWIGQHYDKNYAPNTRETIRKDSIHQFVEAGIAMYNPDQLNRPVNSPKATYQVEPSLLKVLKKFDTPAYKNQIKNYLAIRGSLVAKYAKHRKMNMIPLKINGGKRVSLSPGVHSELIKLIWEQFGARFVPGGRLIYAGDTGDKWGFFDKKLLSSLGVSVDDHGKMPDVVIYYPKMKWLILAEAVTSGGPVHGKRHNELTKLFSKSSAGLVFVTAFPNRKSFTRFANEISWETEVWIADHPTHLIHFDGKRFLGPYTN